MKEKDILVRFNLSICGASYNNDWDEMVESINDWLFSEFKKWTNQINHKWININVTEFGDIIFLHGFEESMEIPLQFGLTKEGVLLEMGITCPEKLPFMPDSFWKQWLELGNYGDFTLTDNEPFPDKDEQKYPHLFHKDTCSLFKLMRNVIAFPILHRYQMVLGNMSIIWPYSKFSIDEVTLKSQLAFQKLYELNKTLMDYRV